MARSTDPIARIPLARSTPRLLALPVVGLLAGVATGALGLSVVAGTLGVALVALGGVVTAMAVVAAAILLSVRIEVEGSAIHLRRLGGRRSYDLVPGPVTRVRLHGEGSSRLRATRSLPGWQLGPARLRGDEPVEVVRLAPTPTAILVPTHRGRLAIAPADEQALLAALADAAHARERLAELMELVPSAAAVAPAVVHEVPERPLTEPGPDREPHLEPWMPEDAASSAAEPDPIFMTGIERAAYEARLAREREAAEAREAAIAQIPEPAPVMPEPSTNAAPAEVSAADGVAEPVPTFGRLRRAIRLGRPRPSAVLVLLPTAGAGVAWAAGLVFGEVPRPGSELGRLTALALVLAGPAATVGAIMARVWWPRLVGVVVAGGLAGAVFVGRSLIGG